MPTILDFQIQPLSAEHYSLAVCERGSVQSLASATFSHRVDFLTDFSVDRLNASTKDAAERFDELQKLGRELYQKLFPPGVEQVWREYKQRSEFLTLCLRFAEGATKLEVLPWETLYDKDNKEFIAAGEKTTLTRLPLDVAPPSELPPIPRPLKLFGFFASPLDLKDHERLNAEREQEILLEAINDPAAEGRISADFEDEAKLEILERSLRDGYHILHFTGHGISPRDGGGLLLEDAHGKKLPASIAEVMQAIERGQDGNAKLRLAVISGCQTARTLHTQGFSDLARELLRQRVPAVIAMQFSISDEGGLKFAESLYREIAKGVELEHAVHAARRVLLADKQFFINNDALAIVLLAADGACLQTTEAQVASPQAEASATYLGDRLDPLAHGFYGRRREYRKIRDALLHQDQRAVIIHGVIIHGIGGIGKTALLTHAINRLRPRFKDVMSFDCRRAALAPETILLELHRYFATQGKPQLQSLIGQSVPPEMLADEIAKLLTEWPLLIVFDNFESQLDEWRAFLNEDLRVFLTTLVRATATGSRFLFTTRVLFDLDGKRLDNLQELPLGDLSRAEALMLMQKLPNLAQAAHRHKLAVLEKFGGHPYALVTLDRYCSQRPLGQALQDADLLKSELHEFLAIELSYQRLSDRARELLNRLAAFRQVAPFAAVEWIMDQQDATASFWQKLKKLLLKQRQVRGIDELIRELTVVSGFPV
ncbi:MAG: CHAT domain-containing protein, partial [Acidobacteria bacterium]|nr:CHAT domain-containing protein [Acidobacteriota bacterium]